MTIRNAVGSANKYSREREGHENMGRACFVRTLMDSLGYLNPASSVGEGVMKMEIRTARSFFDENKKQFILMCDIAGLEPSYIIRLRNALCVSKKKGKLEKLNMKVVVDKLIERA